ncbi:hypothetical protein CcaverHIS631_0406680 [Cutaneotrichosporon cavernicola]|nr:hypothetical protein CcaverHIS631_0406680 [Cutaneotrichosporon cavernicola]BEJ07401.1 hypothetical protein CcaverHIS641_0406700 [Cutaneotrichosporon cavernicola]
MSRLNPNASAFPPKGGRPSVTTKACATPPAKTTTARALNEIDLTRSLTFTATSNNVDGAWPRNKLVTSPTAPHYGHNWATTFPPVKTLTSSGSLSFLGPESSPVTAHLKSPSFPPPTSLHRDHPNVSLGRQPVPTHPMNRQLSPQHAAHMTHGTHSAWSTYSAHPNQDLDDWYSPHFAFKPFGEEGVFEAARRQEVMDSGHSTVAPSAGSHRIYPKRPRSVARDHNGSVFSDDDDELILSRNVYIPNPSVHMTKETLQRYGQNFGRVVSLKVESGGTEVSHDIIGQFPLLGGYDGRRYAFVMFDSNQAAAKFIEGLTAAGIPAIFGRETAHLKHQALQDPHSSNCYFADIPLEFTEQDMRDLVYPARIASMRFLLDSNGNRRGTAMVRMESRHQAEEVIARLDLKYKPMGYSKCIQVRIADSENQKAFKQNRSRNDSPKGNGGSYGSSSPSSNASRSSSFSSSCDAHSAFDMAAHLCNSQQMVTHLQERLVQQHSLNLTTESARRRVIDVSNMLSRTPYSPDDLASYPSPYPTAEATAPRMPSVSPGFKIAHGIPNSPTWDAWGRGTTAPPPTRVPSAGSSHSNFPPESFQCHGVQISGRR